MHCRKWKIKFCFHNILASAFPQQHRFFFFLLHFLSHPILHLPHPPARFWCFLSRRQALYSAEHPPGSAGLLTLNSRMLCVRTVKSGSTCFLLPFTAYVFPSHNFNMLFLTFFTSFSIFLFLLPFTALNFSIFFLPIPQFPLPTPPTKNKHPVKLSFFFPISSCFVVFQSFSLVLFFLPLTSLTTPRDMFPQPFTDLFTYIFIAFGCWPHRSPHIFHISHQLPVLAHVPCSGGTFLHSTPPAMGTQHLQPIEHLGLR